MIRVLYVTHNFLEVNAQELYALIGSAEGIELTVVVPRQNPGIAKTSEAFRLETARFRNADNYLEGFERADLTALMKSVKPDIIQCMSEAFSPYVLQIAWLALRHAPKAKVLFYAYENSPLSARLRARVKNRPAWKWRLAGGEAASQEAADTLRRAGFPPDKPIKVIPYGIGTRTFVPMDRDACKLEFGLAGRKVVGYIGRLVEEKGLTTLLAAMTDVPEAHCLIIGRGPLTPDIQLWSTLPALQERVSRVDEADPDTLGRYMNAFNILALPSVRTPHWMEQYGRVLVEAMACGTPVIGTRSGAIPDVIGDAGAIVDEYDWKALAREIGHLFNDSDHWQEMSRRALARAPQFSDKAMSAALVQFFREIMQGDS